MRRRWIPPAPAPPAAAYGAVGSHTGAAVVFYGRSGVLGVFAVWSRRSGVSWLPDRFHAKALSSLR